MAKKEYTYDVTDVISGEVICMDKTRSDLLLELGMDLNFGNCLRTGHLLKDRYQVKCRREFERKNTLDDRMLAEFEAECRKFRGLKWSKTAGFDLASAWKRWKERQEAPKELRWTK